MLKINLPRVGLEPTTCYVSVRQTFSVATGSRPGDLSNTDYCSIASYFCDENYALSVMTVSPSMCPTLVHAMHTC
jgi:hypothetical protein